MSMQLFYAFAIGASFAASFVTILYLSSAYAKVQDRPPDASLTSLLIGSRIGYGLANVVNVFFGNTLRSSLLVGALFGEVLSLVGRFKLDLPKRLFRMEKHQEDLVHIIAPILYAAIFATIVRALNKLIT